MLYSNFSRLVIGYWQQVMEFHWIKIWQVDCVTPLHKFGIFKKLFCQLQTRMRSAMFIVLKNGRFRAVQSRKPAQG